MKVVDVKSSTYIDSSKEINDKDAKFIIGDIVRISKYKNVFAKGYTPNWSEKVFVIKKVKILCHGYILLMREKLRKFVTKGNQGVDTSNFAKKADLTNLKSDVDKLDIDKLKNVPTNLRNWKNKVDKLDVDKFVHVSVDLSKVVDVVKNDIVKKMYIML